MAKKKILVVEDDFDTRYVLSLILKAEGYEVITVADGLCALGVILEERPDLIITDINLPRVNGIDLIRQLREAPITAAIPILAVTAYGQSAARNAEEAGASFCFRKPLSFNELLPQVRSLLT